MNNPSPTADAKSSTGEFKRQEDAFRDWISADGSTGFPATAGRYHLYVSLACPWATRTAIVRKLLALEDAIGMTVIDPIRDEHGWAFRKGPDYDTDPINGFAYLAEAYTATNPDYQAHVTVPVLWDKQTKRIVNNSEDDICRMFQDAFRQFGNEVDLFPRDIAEEQAQLSKFLYENVNNGVYLAGFAISQRAYEASCRKVFAALDQLEERLAAQRYLFGKRLVESDLRLFCTLIRFDAVYHGHFKCNLSRIADYANLQGYLMDLYQQPEIAQYVNLDHIKRHYYITQRDINPTGIVPIGPKLHLTGPHGREAL